MVLRELLGEVLWFDLSQLNGIDVLVLCLGEYPPRESDIRGTEIVAHQEALANNRIEGNRSQRADR